MPDIGAALIFADNSGTQWHGLDLSTAWRGKRVDRKDGSYRYVSRSIHALTCRVADIGRVKASFANGSLDFFAHGPRDYRGYLGEYPRRWPYRSRLSDPLSFVVKNADIEFDAVKIRQLRGHEWERDYSVVGESPSLLMPSPDLIAVGDLQWDGHGSWLNAQGINLITDPWWRSDKGPGLLIRLDYLDRILEEKRKALVIMGFQTKFVAGTNKGAGRFTEHTLFIRKKSQTKLSKRKIVRD